MSVSIQHPDVFIRRHIGPSPADVPVMLEAVGAPSLDALIDQTIPASIRRTQPLNLPGAVSEQQALAELDALGSQNQLFRSFIGMGYTDCITPPVILRNVLENPGWYTQYTPYQAEIAQGRLEALLNYQTMIIDLTGLDVANASLLDDATAAAEAMHMMAGITGTAQKNTLLVDEDTHPQIIGVIQTRARAIGIDVRVAPVGVGSVTADVFGLVLSYPKSSGGIDGWESVIAEAHGAGALVTLVADLLGLALLKSPGELGADIAVGSAQRFGVPMGFGGPYAAFMATRTEHVRKMPGRIIGVSEDSAGRPALRMALATREQHIRREKATSNICTAQALLAITASMYAVYHGPAGIKGIAEKVHGLAAILGDALTQAGLKVRAKAVFDTVCVEGSPDQQARWVADASARRINLRTFADGAVSITFDEATQPADVAELVMLFTGQTVDVAAKAQGLSSPIPAELQRTSAYLTHPVFNSYHSETDMLRYMRTLELRDLSLAHAMIPLGSCTMKLNATAEMVAITRPSWAKMHPFAPASQTQGYRALFQDLEQWLSEITGFPGISLQPNAGSQGEYAGLLVIRAYLEAQGQGHRDVCLIPSSAHGTNPASAVMAGLKVVVVACDSEGNIDLKDLEVKARQHAQKLAALMVTYPSTHGVFEEEIKAICALIHTHGGQVYMDGANMNAQVGLTRPADIGADVCHLNLHKTFCIPHGGGGPGMGPIGVAAHLKDFLPNHPVVDLGHAHGIGPVSSGPWGSASILPISWAYVRMMGGEGLTEATRVAILNANYVASRLDPYFKVLYRGGHGRVAHECILDMRAFKKTAGIEVDDIAKRLMDFGFHAPTMSFPIPSTMMVEPTESESKAELDRFIEALVAIRDEIAAIEAEAQPREGNVLKNAPHTADAVTSIEWEHPYSRKAAAFPAPWVRSHKFWPAVGRINNALGDRKLICSCPPIEDYSSAS